MLSVSRAGIRSAPNCSLHIEEYERYPRAWISSFKDLGSDLYLLQVFQSFDNNALENTLIIGCKGRVDKSYQHPIVKSIKTVEDDVRQP